MILLNIALGWIFAQTALLFVVGHALACRAER